MNADPDPDPDPGQTLSQKVEFLREKYTWKKVIGKKHSYEDKKDFWKGRKPELFENFGQFPCSWIWAFTIRMRNRVQDSQMNVYRIQVDPHPDPDPKHWLVLSGWGPIIIVEIKIGSFWILIPLRIPIQDSRMNADPSGSAN
jgi:hypothetical protein